MHILVCLDSAGHPSYTLKVYSLYPQCRVPTSAEERRNQRYDCSLECDILGDIGESMSRLAPLALDPMSFR